MYFVRKYIFPTKIFEVYIKSNYYGAGTSTGTGIIGNQFVLKEHENSKKLVKRPLWTFQKR
jgi:hypothetical protein